MAEQPLAKHGPATQSPTTLNDLPREELLHLLIHLPIMDAIKASPISRKWRNLWHSLPSLEFKRNQVCRNPSYVASQTRQNFSDEISQVLLNRPYNLPFYEFSLLFHYFRNHRYRSLVTSWLRYALNCEVVVLKLDFRVDPFILDEDGDCDGSKDRHLYDFHFCHLRNNTSVRFLMLCRCEIFIPSDGLRCFRSITRLELFEVDVADKVLSDLVSRCESLEKLVLSGFHGLKKFRIVSGTLKELELSCYYIKTWKDTASSVRICAPNLSKIKIDRFYVKNYEGYLSSVVDAELEFRKRKGYAVRCWINSMRFLTGVERLSVQNFLPQVMETRALKWPGQRVARGTWANSTLYKSGEAFEFKNLKHLVIKTGYTHDEMFCLAAFLTGSPVLQTIVLDSVYHTYEPGSLTSYAISPFVFDIPSLQVVKMRNFKNTNTEYHVLALLGSERVVLNKVVLIPAKLEKASLNGPIVIDLTAYSDRTSVIAELLRRLYNPEK